MTDAAPPRPADDLRKLLVHLIRAALLGDDQRAADERREALCLHDRVRGEATAFASLRLDGLWTAAVAEAEAPDTDGAPFQASIQLPANCPIALGELVEPGLKIAELEARIRDSAATG